MAVPILFITCRRVPSEQIAAPWALPGSLRFFFLCVTIPRAPPPPWPDDSQPTPCASPQLDSEDVAILMQWLQSPGELLDRQNQRERKRSRVHGRRPPFGRSLADAAVD